MDIKITDVTTTLLHNPEGFAVQDATIPPLKEGAKGSTALFVHIKTDAGFEGLGTCAGLKATRSVIEDNLKDLLIGQDPFAIEKLWNDMFWRVRGYGRKGIAFQALSAVDIALWDLKAKALDLPLYRLLGPYTDTVPIYGSGGWTNYTEDELVEEQMSYVNRGIPRIKMKVGKDFGQSEREDVERLESVRKAVGDDVEIFVDANNGYYAKQAIRMAAIFEEYDVGWFEEPVLADDYRRSCRRCWINHDSCRHRRARIHQVWLQRPHLSGCGGYSPARHRPGGRSDRVDEGGPYGARLQPARRAARVPGNTPAHCLRDAQPESCRVSRQR